MLTRSGNSPGTRLDIHSLETVVQQYFAAGIAQSTSRVYESAKRRYVSFCSSHQLSQLPLNENTLCLFVAQLAVSGLKAQSIKCYLSGLRHYQISAGLSDPFTAGSFPRLHYIVKGIRREVGSQSKRRMPITPPILRGLLSVWSRRSPRQDAVMLWAACTLAFFGFFRSGEITVPSDQGFDPTVHLTTRDVQVDSRNSPSMLCIHLKQSKTDPFRAGAKIWIGKTGDILCPVTAVLSYLAAHPGGDGALFVFQNGRPLTRSRLVKELHQGLQEMGMDPSTYSGHSFRIGAATTAHAAGMEDSTIRMLGRWESDAVMKYIRTPPESLAQLTQRLCR